MQYGYQDIKLFLHLNKKKVFIFLSISKPLMVIMIGSYKWRVKLKIPFIEIIKAMFIISLWTVVKIKLLKIHLMSLMYIVCLWSPLTLKIIFNKMMYSGDTISMKDSPFHMSRKVLCKAWTIMWKNNEGNWKFNYWEKQRKGIMVNNATVIN